MRGPIDFWGTIGAGLISVAFGYFFFKAVRIRRDYPTIKPETFRNRTSEK
jgi:hypothetical protein